MRLSLSIVTTIIIALIVWLIMLWQPPESWSDNAITYEDLLAHGTNSQYDIAMDIDTSVIKTGVTTAKNMSANAEVITPSIKQQDTLSIAGVNRRIALVDIGALWIEFGENRHLERALSTNTFDVYAIYRQFNASYSVADVSIGYELAALNDSVSSTQTLPTGKRYTVLAQGHYQNIDIVTAWENIDYRRGLVAVIETRHFNGDDETVSLQAIYQE